MSVMFSTLKRLREEGRLTDQMIANAIAKGWITQEEVDALYAIH